MSLPAKRQHDETMAAAVTGISKGLDLGKHAAATGEVPVTDAMDLRPAKLARHECASEPAAAAGYFHKRDVAGLEVTLGEPRGEAKLKMREYVSEVKVEREGRDLWPPVGVGSWETWEGKEFLGRAAGKGEEPPWGAGPLELGEIREGMNLAEAPARRRSPCEDEGKGQGDGPDAKKDDRERGEEPKEKEKEELPPPPPPPPHSVVLKKEIDRDERDREKGEKEKERVRSREKEKEGGSRGRGEKREKERGDRDAHRRERAEREEKEEAKGGVDNADAERKPAGDEKDVRDRDREKERDDAEGEGFEKRKKRAREHEKERNDSVESAITDGDADTDKDKDAVVSYGVQQRKRMLRPRGQSNPAARDSRSRFRPKDNEGTQGRSESSVLLYRIGEGMPELSKLRKDYEASERSSLANGPGPTVEIHIPAELATTSNRQIRGSQLWGTDVYTDDSDIVAVLMHTGYYTPTGTPPPHSISELRATIRIFESQKTYTSMLRNSLRSRAWGGGSGCSYSVERCRIIKAGGGSVELEPCLTRTPPVAPTLAPAAAERTVTTRAASSSAYRQQRFMQEVTIQYNLCNEPWLKYSMSIVADRGLKKSQFTSARLKRGDVLYVETHSIRYELAYDGERTACNGVTTATSASPQPQPPPAGPEKGKEKWGFSERATAGGAHEKGPGAHAHNGDKAHGGGHLLNNGEASGHHGPHHVGEPHEHYRWSKCKRPLPLPSMRSNGVPLPSEFVEVVQDNLAWEEVQWSPTSVWVQGTEYVLARAHFFSPMVDDMDE